MDTYEHLFDEFYLLKLHSEITDKRLDAARVRILELETKVQELRREYEDFKQNQLDAPITGELRILRPSIP